MIKASVICILGVMFFILTMLNVSADDISIRNLGVTRIENTSSEYTSTRAVSLLLNFSNNANKCRYTNYFNDSAQPLENYSGWSVWEECLSNKLWLLTENPGMKYVYYNVNYSLTNSTFNDSIYYNSTGAGLDITPPTQPVILGQNDSIYNVTSGNNTITVSWTASKDNESEVFGLPIIYEYTLYLSNGALLNQSRTVQTSFTVTNTTGFNLPHGTVVYLNLTALNSGNLRSNATSYPYNLTIDLSKPQVTLASKNATNLTSMANITLPQSTWINANNAIFSWNASDTTSQVIMYSYSLSKENLTNPDDVPDGTFGSLAVELSKTYSSLASGKYYFKVKAKDSAGNWGDPTTYEFWLDNTPPEKPEIISQNRTSSSATYVWAESSDPESNISFYNVSLFYSTGVFYRNVSLFGISNTTYTFTGISDGLFNVSIDAINGAGLSSRKIGKKEDFTALVIAASPTALSLADSPVLRAWTNKQSTCFYNGSGAKPTFFDYTNTTYHEAKVRKESSMTLNYTITCTDLSTNSASAYVNFTINTSRTAGSAVISGFSTFEGIITTAEINLTDSGTLLSGADNKRFNISIDGKIVDFCLFDNGNGFYNISFVAPETYGTHELKVIFDSVPFTISFEVKRLYLFASYLEAGINALNTTHITYNEFSGRRIGLATDAQRSRINISSGTNSLSLTYIPLHSSIFIFNTRKAGSINNKEKQLSEKLDLGTKSFGYDLGLKELADFILRYDEFAIASVGFNVTQKGKYNFNTIKTVTREGETQLIFSR